MGSVALRVGRCLRVAQNPYRQTSQPRTPVVLHPDLANARAKRRRDAKDDRPHPGYDKQGLPPA
jgi:hypothetical protein